MAKDKPTSTSQFWLFGENFKTLGSALALAMVIRIVLFEAFEIEGPSMEPSLLNGDRVVVAKYKYGLFLPFTDQAIVNWNGPNPGDVVILKSPMDNIDIVKRIIGVAGDTVEVKQDRILRNGRPVPRKQIGACTVDPCAPYGGSTDLLACSVFKETLDAYSYAVSFASDTVESMISTPEVTVPEDHVYVMGDHRDHSNDSRYFGLVPVTRIKGKALAVYWSSESKDAALSMGETPQNWWDRLRRCRLGSAVR